MKQQMVEQITGLDNPESVPYQTRLSMSAFLGEPLDASMAPQALLANQQAFQQENQQNANSQAKPSKTGMGKIAEGKRTGLGMEQEEA